MQALQSEIPEGIQQKIAEINRLCHDAQEVVNFWQVLHTPEFDKALMRESRRSRHTNNGRRYRNAVSIFNQSV